METSKNAANKFVTGISKVPGVSLDGGIARSSILKLTELRLKIKKGFKFQIV